jgi:hypothetical protein
MRIVLTVLLFVVAGGANAQEAWTLTTADFRNSTVVLRGIDAAGVRVAEAGAGEAPGQPAAERVVAMEEFLQVERPVPASAQQGKFVLHLSGGDQLAGEPASIQGEQLVWASAAAGELRVPLSRAAAVTRPGQRPPERRQTEDVVTLANGDTVRGIIAGIEGGRVLVQRADAAEPLPVPVDSMASILFAATAPARGTSAAGGNGAGGAAGRGFRLRLGDGSSIPATALTLRGARLNADLGDGKPRPIDLSRVAAIEQVNGPASWLSGRPPSENTYVPFFGAGQDFPARMDQSVDGTRDLRFGGKTFTRAIGVHAYSRLTWPLDGAYGAFRTQYAVDERLAHADVTVRIRAGDKIVHEKKGVRGGTLSPVVVVDLAGAKSLTLEVDYGSGTDVQDRLVWLEPALLRKRPGSDPR